MGEGKNAAVPYYNVDLVGIANNWCCAPGKGTSIASSNMTFGGRYFVSIGNCLGTIGTSSTCYNYAVMVASYNSTIGNLDKTSMFGLQNCTATAANSTYFDGVLKTIGSFQIPHPDPEKTNTHILVHNFVEAPTVGDNIYRYKVTTQNCQAVIELPSYYKFLNKNTIIKVSPANNLGTGYAVLDNTSSFITFTSNCDGDYNILLIGTRIDNDAWRSWCGVEPYQF
jgi:hypothetical protein